MVNTNNLQTITDASLDTIIWLLKGLNNPEEKCRVVVDFFSSFGQCLDEKRIRQITQCANILSDDSDIAQNILTSIQQINNQAALWLKAAILERMKRYSDAAVVLDSISDTASNEIRSVRMLARAKNLIKTEAWEDSWKTLSEGISISNSYKMLCIADNLLSRIRKQDKVIWKRKSKIALIGSTTLNLLVPILRAKCAASGIAADIYCGEFAQYNQEILDPDSGLAAFSPDVIIIAPDWRALSLPDEVNDPDTISETHISSLKNLWRRCLDRWGAFVIQHNFDIPPTDPYGYMSAAKKNGRGRVIRQINLKLWEAAEHEGGVAILDVEQIASIFGKTTWTDPALWHTARQYPSAEALPLLAHYQAGLLRAFYGLSAKCLVVDLDNTLWGGVIGEDGITGIELGGTPAGEAYIEFQHYLQSLRRRGIILAVCSKNDEHEAKRPFYEHPEMIVTLNDFAMFVANWQPKDENLRLIAKTLNIGIDSLLFVDDNPTERDWVRRQIPEVIVPEMPQDPALFINVLDKGRYFESLSLTDEDRLRSDTYRANAQRTILQSSSENLDDFLAGLQMKVELMPFNDSNLPRIIQLINKTNQFNLTTRRTSEATVCDLMNQSECYTQTMRLIDRFGDNGLVGVLIAFVESGNLRIDTWLISCRVLGRRVEDVMINAAMQYAMKNDLTSVIGEYIPTSKNGQVKDIYDRLGFMRVEETSEGARTYRWDMSWPVRQLPDFFSINDSTQRECGLITGGS